MDYEESPLFPALDNDLVVFKVYTSYLLKVPTFLEFISLHIKNWKSHIQSNLQYI